ncbi:hypothetical protein Scep_012299 [Stephania cephalantha]|uniref:Exoribonuclease phosphorolytic domain-containing protein n=1 Tax=Stephania cephalantha TaxID=152367 RepID=A0AAP0JEP1_9MAGN
MGGRMTMTLNANGDVCAIQKSGGEGVLPSTIMQCLRIASVKASDITNKIKDSVVAYNTERALKKIKRHSSIVAVDFSVPDIKMEDYQCQSTIQRGVGEFSVGHDSLKLKKDESYSGKSHCLGEKTAKSAQNEDTGKGLNVKKCSKAPSTWDTYSKGIDSEALMASLVLSESSGPNKKKNLPKEDEKPSKSKHHESALVSSSSVTASSAPTDVKGPSQKASGVKTLKDAVKPKNKRKKKALSGSDGTSSCII